MKIKFGCKMSDSVTVHFDGEKYLVLNPNTEFWGEGKTLDDAYCAYKNKISDTPLTSQERTPLFDVSLIWIAYRKKILCVLVLFAFIYAQTAVILAVPSYLARAIGVSTPSRIVYILDKVVDKINTMPPADVEKINSSLLRLKISMARFPMVDAFIFPSQDEDSK